MADGLPSTPEPDSTPDPTPAEPGGVTAEAPPSKTRGRIILVLKFGLAIGLFWWLAKSGKLPLEKLAEIGDRWPWLLAAQIPFGIVMLLAAIRWKILLRAQEIELPLRDSYSLSMIGLFFNQLVPGSTGGDVYKAYAVARAHPGRKSGGVVSVFVDRALGLIMLLLLVAVGMLANWRWVSSDPDLSSFATGIAILLAGLAVGGTLFFSTRARKLLPLATIGRKLPLKEILAKVDQAVFIYRFHLRRVFTAATLTAILHSLVVTTNIVLAMALWSEPFEWWHFFYLIPMAHLAMAIPLNPPGAIGTAEAMYAYLLALVGIEEGALLCILQRLTYYSWSLVGAGFYVMRRKSPSDETPRARTNEAASADGVMP
ncbi:MAG: lysylphosphatidylglycerol synthase transmembrane domain-containing protein [Planctomycetota bacterium]